MNRQERARILASLTDEEVEQLRKRTSGAATSDELRFAKALFSGSDDDQDRGDEQDQGASEYSAEQRQWARELFADDEDKPLLAGLAGGRTAGRTTPPRAEPVDEGGWFDRQPIADD